MTAGPVTVRRRGPGDLAACVALLARVHATDGYPTRASAVSEEWLTAAADAPAWVAVDAAGRVLGHVALVPRPEAGTVEVSRLFSDAAARGRGVGGALLAAAVADAGRQGAPVVLEVVEGTPAVGFYARAGWRPTGSHAATWTAPDGSHPTLRTFAGPAAPEGT